MPWIPNCKVMRPRPASSAKQRYGRTPAPGAAEQRGIFSGRPGAAAEDAVERRLAPRKTDVLQVNLPAVHVRRAMVAMASHFASSGRAASRVQNGSNPGRSPVSANAVGAKPAVDATIGASRFRVRRVTSPMCSACRRPAVSGFVPTTTVRVGNRRASGPTPYFTVVPRT